MVYTIDDIKARVIPIATSYQLPVVYLFGSYAKGQADEESDIDLAVSLDGTDLSGFDLFRLEDMLQAQFDCPLDFLITEDIELARNPMQIELRDNFRKDRVVLYEANRIGTGFALS